MKICLNFNTSSVRMDDNVLAQEDQFRLNMAFIEVSRWKGCLPVDVRPQFPVSYCLTTSVTSVNLYDIPQFTRISVTDFEKLSGFEVPTVYGMPASDLVEIMVLTQRSHPASLIYAARMRWPIKKFTVKPGDTLFIVRDGSGDHVSLEYESGTYVCIRAV